MALGRIGSDADSAIPDLVPLLGSRSDRIRREATLALPQLGKGAIEPLVDASASKDVTIRSAAIESLGFVHAPEESIQQRVLECTSDGVPAVEAAALRSLARLKPAEDTIVPVVDLKLGEENTEVRLAAVNLVMGRRALLPRLKARLMLLLSAKDSGVSGHAAFLLGAMGPDAAPMLIAALRDKRSRVEQIAKALAQIGQPAQVAILKAVTTGEPRVRQTAALALGQIRPPVAGAVEILVLGLKDPNADVKTACLTAVRELGPRAANALPVVRTMLTDRSSAVRVQVIEILGQSAPRDAQLLADITPALDDDEPTVQRRAIEIIRSLGPLGRSALGKVMSKLNSDDRSVRLAAMEMIGTQGDAAADAVQPLIALLDDPAPALRTSAAQTLGKLGKVAQPSADRLTSLLGAKEVEVREAAASALGSLELEGDALRPHLAKALQDEKPEVRRAAMRAVQRLGPQGSVFLPDIILLAANKDNARMVERSLRAFERRGPDPRSIPELMKQLEHEKESVRLLAIKFLGLCGESAKDAIPALEKLREDPSAEVRKRAEAACEQIKQHPITREIEK
jgi:HEAT repeat protein